MNLIIVNELQAQIQTGQRKVITATGRTTLFEELDMAGQAIAEGGICTDAECDCAGEWYHWRAQ